MKTHYVPKDDLQLLILLPVVNVVPGEKPRALWVLGHYTSTLHSELYPQPFSFLRQHHTPQPRLTWNSLYNPSRS